MKIQILGSGCQKCNKLAEVAVKAAKDLCVDYELEKITDINRIMEFGVMMTPAMVVNGVVKTVGQVPSIEKVKLMLNGK